MCRKQVRFDLVALLICAFTRLPFVWSDAVSDGTSCKKTSKLATPAGDIDVCEDDNDAIRRALCDKRTSCELITPNENSDDLFLNVGTDPRKNTLYIAEVSLCPRGQIFCPALHTEVWLIRRTTDDKFFKQLLIKEDGYKWEGICSYDRAKNQLKWGRGGGPMQGGPWGDVFTIQLNPPKVLSEEITSTDGLQHTTIQTRSWKNSPMHYNSAIKPLIYCTSSCSVK